MSKAKPWYHKNAPRWDGGVIPPVKEQNKFPSKKKKNVTLYWYVRRPERLSRRRWLRQRHTYVFSSYEDPMRIIVDERKRKFKNRTAALQSLEAEKRHLNYLGWKLINYRIEE